MAQKFMSSTITIPDKVNHFILQLAEMKQSTKHFYFMALEFRTTYQLKIQ